MFKTILVHVDLDDPGTADRIQVAAHLCEDCHATLVGAAASLSEASVELLASGGAAIAAGVLTGEPDQLNERFEVAHKEFARWTAGLPIETAWRTAIDFPAHALGDFAGMADLVVMGPARPSSPANSYLDYGELVMRAGRPVLLVPHGIDRLDRNSAVVAWRNTRESRRALADAVPLLATFGAVTLLHIREAADDANEAASMADAATFLAGHTIAAATKVIDAGRQSPAQALDEFVRRSQASLIVAGAYGHTRLREWVLGGVTRDLLRQSPVACLFSR